MLLKGAYCVGEHFVDPQCSLMGKRLAVFQLKLSFNPRFLVKNAKKKIF